MTPRPVTTSITTCRDALKHVFEPEDYELTTYLDNCNYERTEWLEKVFERLPSVANLGGKHIYNVKPEVSINVSGNRRLIDKHSLRYIGNEYAGQCFANTFAVFCFSDLDIIFGYMSTNGKLFLVDTTLEKLYETLGNDVFVSILSQVKAFRENATIKYTKTLKEESDVLKEELTSVLVHKLASGLSATDMLTEARMNEILDEHVSNIIDPEKVDCLGGLVLLGRNEFYRKSILSYLTSHTRIEDAAFLAGYECAYTYMKLFEEMGYKIVGNYFSKTVNLVPNRCYIGNECYMLPKDHGYIIKEIKIHRNQIKIGNHIIPSAVGYHPHLNSDGIGDARGSGTLCLGEYRPDAFFIKKDINPNEFKEAVLGLEDTLSSIYFGSTFFDGERYNPADLQKDKMAKSHSTRKVKLKKV